MYILIDITKFKLLVVIQTSPLVAVATLSRLPLSVPCFETMTELKEN